MKKTIIAVAALLALTATSVRAAGGCAALVERKCTDCHQISRVCKKVGKKSRTRWKRTIKRMVRHGTSLGKDEFNTILNCLLKPGDDVRAMCE